MDPLQVLHRSQEVTQILSIRIYHMTMELMEDVHMVEYDIYEKSSYLGEAENIYISLRLMKNCEYRPKSSSCATSSESEGS